MRAGGSSNSGSALHQGGLLPLDPSSPEAQGIFCQGSIEQDYEVEKEPIARGKFAAVRRARHRSSGQMFAAKYIRRRRTSSNPENEAMHEVAVLLLGRSHHYIISVHQLYQTRNEYIILLEFASGGDLQRLLECQMCLSEGRVRRLLGQVLQGLRFLHTNHIAHLDVKPQNLVMMGESPDSSVKLVDFGLSRRIVEGVDLSIIMGTPDYMAPEVINYEPVSLATDMWAVGVLTYVLLTGHTPFGGDTVQNTFANITQAEYDFPDELFSDVSEEAKEFISALLVQRQRERLTVDECLSHTWLCSDVMEEVYAPSDPDPDPLYPVPEADTADSAYSSDSNGTSTDGYSNSLNISDLCRCPIPEEHHPEMILNSGHTSVHRDGLNYSTVGIEEALNSNSHRPRISTRHSSLILDGYGDSRILELRSRVENLIPIDLDVDSAISCLYCDEPSHDENGTVCYNSDFHDNGDAASVVSWDDYSELGSKKNDQNQFDQTSLNNMAKPWEKLCNGSISRAINQLPVKSSCPKKSDEKLNNIEVNNIDTNECLMSNCDYNDLPSPPVCNLQSISPIMRASVCDIRVTKSEKKKSKTDFKTSKTDLRASKNDLRGSKRDLRTSKNNDNRQSKSEHKNLHHTKSDYREPRRNGGLKRSDMTASSYNINQPPPKNSFGYHSSLSLNQLNISFSTLDLPHESLDQSQDSEERDIVYNDLTLPRRRLDKTGYPSLRRGNSFHMSFRMPRKRDTKV